MQPVAAGTITLRLTDRRDLVRALERLGSVDPAERARVAQRVADLVQRRGARWGDLLLPASDEVTGVAGVEVLQVVWPAPVLALMNHPALTDQEHTELRRLAAWRAPGQSGLERLRTIAARVGAD
jgi:hypothetical protein